MVLCLTSARFNMRADVLRQTDGSSTPTPEGEWKSQQDPITGEIIRVWVPMDIDSGTPGTQNFSVPCQVRGVITGGVRALGTAESWGDLYHKTDIVQMEFPSRYIISDRDRITNIRNAQGKVIWIEEETPQGSSSTLFFSPTVFDVKGVTPILDPFSNHTSNMAILERSEVQ